MSKIRCTACGEIAAFDEENLVREFEFCAYCREHDLHERAESVKRDLEELAEDLEKATNLVDFDPALVALINQLTASLKEINHV